MQGHAVAILSGRVMETYEFERPLVRYKQTRERGVKYARIGVRREDAIKRAKVQFRRLILANLVRKEPSALLTLTVLGVVPVDIGYRYFTRFIQRLREKTGWDVAYIGVPEFQKRGAIHFHVIVWGISRYDVNRERRTRNIQRTWGHGYVDCVSANRSIKLAGYLSKYMSKAMHDERLRGRRAYCTSRSVLRPVRISLTSALDTVDFIMNETNFVDNNLVHQREFETKWLGKGRYKRYVAK